MNTFWTIAFIIAIILLVAGVVIYFLNSWASKKSALQNEMVAQHKQTVSMYIIDKKKDRMTNANMPRAMIEQVPRLGRMMKVPLVKAKVGPQIMTMVCEAETFKALPVKKTVQVEIAGAYIVSMKGMKTKVQLDQQRRARRKSTEEAVPVKWHEKLSAKIRGK